MPPGAEPLRPPRRRRQERPDPNEDLIVDDAAIVRVMDKEDGRHMLARDVLGRDYVRLMRLRMEVNSSVQRGEPMYVCSICGAAVRIRRSPTRPKFFFKHRHEDGNCPAITAGQLSQGEINARQYNGAKESRLHRRMKDWISECLAADGRFTDIKQEPTWKGTLTGERRRPDVRAGYNGLPIAFEVQLSTTHLDVISARRDFYLQEGGLLFWVFAEFTADRRRMTDDDVFYNNNLNAFVVDASTVAASLDAEEFKLECVWSVPTADGDTSSLHRRLTSFHELKLQLEQQRAFYFDFDARRQEMQAASDAERQKLRDDVEAWIGATGYYSENANKAWTQFRARFRRQGVELPRHLSKFDRPVLTMLYSAKHNRPWGQDQKKLVEVAHRVAGAYKHHLTWFMHAVRHYGREESMKAEGKPGHWQRRCEELRAQYLRDRTPFEPKRDAQAMLELLFPELFPLP
jgi:Spy/CpxP family protein refolding chaperone